MSTHQLDLQDLQNELNTFRGKFDQWIKDTIIATESLKEQHVAKLREFQATIRELEQHQKNLAKRAEQVQKRLLAEDAEMQELENELALIRGEQDALPARLQELKNALDAEQREAEKRAASFAGQEEKKKRKMHALEKALEYYRDRLGLAFEQSEDGILSFVLTHIDPNDHTRPFIFSVRMEETDTKDIYHVESCEPPVEKIDMLVASLNADNDFSKFVQHIRAEFKAMV